MKQLTNYFRLYVFSGLVLIIVSNCESSNEKNDSTLEIIESDLSFKLIEFGSFYALADGLGEEIIPYIDSLNALPQTTLSANEKQFLETANRLNDHDLLFLPSFSLTVDSLTYRVYLDASDYALIKDFNRIDLIREGKKVQIRLKGEKISADSEDNFRIFRAHKILSVEKVDGKTEWRE